MSAAEFFAASKILIVAGKGGVGKTTVGATIGVAAARAGLSTLLIELEGHSTLASPFGIDAPGYEPAPIDLGPGVAGSLSIRRLTPDEALTDYLGDHGLTALSGRLVKSSVIELVATTAPGIKDLVTLGKIRSLEQAGDVDLIVVDAPAAGHAITFLQAAAGLADSAPSGPIREQADQVLAMLADGDRCRVILVTLPEETPVSELIDTSYALEDDVGVQLGPVVVNGLWDPIDGLEAASARLASATSSGVTGGDPQTGHEPELAAAAEFRLARQRSQAAEVARLDRELPLPQLHLPFVFATGIDRDGLDRLADALTAQLNAGPMP